MRTFIALELGETLTRRLESERARLSRAAPGARWVRQDSLHLTLAFLGEVPDALIPRINEALVGLVADHRPHLLQVRGGGTFGPLDSPKVLWVGIGGEDQVALETLQRALVKRLAPLGVAPDHARFSPHITLARAKGPRGDPMLGRCADGLVGLELGSLAARELVLFASETGPAGMRYRALARHPLSDSAAARLETGQSARR